MLGAAYELLDEQTADRLEEELFRGGADGVRPRAAHARRVRRALLAAGPDLRAAFGRPALAGRAGFLERAGEAITEADTLLAELQDSLLPVEVGDPELRSGLAEIRTLVGELAGRAQQFVSRFGR